MYDRIVVALDGSELAERILPHVQSLAKEFDSKVLLLQSVAPTELIPARDGVPITTASGMVPPAGPMRTPRPTIEAFQQDTSVYLNAVAHRLEAQGIKVEYRVVDRAAAEAIVDVARSIDADLIAMTTHGRGGLKRLVFGSVADEVLRTAPCPVLLVRVSGDDAGESKADSV